MSGFLKIVEADRTTGTIKDSEWDRFVAKVPGTHYQQMSSWGRINGFKNWRIHRVLAIKSDQIVGGAQILSDFSVPGAHVGYVLNAPLYQVSDEYAKTSLLGRLIRLAKELPIHELLLQPAIIHSTSKDQLTRFGFEPSDKCLEPKATVLLDLSLNLEILLQEMKARTRANIRRSGRGKVIVIEGTTMHLPIFYNILVATARRGNFSALPFAVFERILAAWLPKESIQLFMAKCQDEFVSGQLVIGCGDTVVNLLSVWSGSCGREKPNDALQWKTIKWAKENGYKWYDLNGIDERTVERKLPNREESNNGIAESFSSFKLGYGGEILLRPGLFRLDLCSKWQRGFADLSKWVFRSRRALRY